MTGSFAVNHNTFNNALGLYVKNLELRSFAKMLACASSGSTINGRVTDRYFCYLDS